MQKPSFADFAYEEPLFNINKEKIAEIKALSLSIEQRTTKGQTSFLISEEKLKRYRESLNEQQFIAATTVDGPVMIIAGAGSGKTSTLTNRVAYLIESGIVPERILLLTFTRKAAKEMLHRVSTLVSGDKAFNVSGGTFHSFASNILRKYHKMVGLSNNFTILDVQDSGDIIEIVKTEAGLKELKTLPKKNKIYEVFSKSSNSNISLQEAIEAIVPDASGLIEQISIIFNKYSEYKKEHDMLDFDDLLSTFNDALLTIPAFCKEIQSRFDYIMVDEYQDTNFCQNSIVNIISDVHKNIMIVGDDSQSIYAFRGAHVENILRYPDVFPDCKVIKLEQNYRSTQNILNLVNSINDSFIVGYKKFLYSNKPNGPKPTVHILYNAEEEARVIVQKIKKSINDGIKPKEHAILFRSSMHNILVQNELMKNRIPFVVYGGMKFAEKRHIKDMSAFIKVCVNSKDTVAWNRILNLIEGIGKKTSQEISKALSKDMLAISTMVNKKYYGKLSLLISIISKFKKTGNVSEMTEALLSFYLPILENIEDDFDKRKDEISIFISLANESQNIDEFIAEFVLEPPNRFRSNGTIANDNDDSIIISTIHSAKGLEWHTVFVCHLLDGLFPSYRAFEDMNEIEEERRLFYVATSRAKEQLYLTMPSSYYSRSAIYETPSRFLKDIGTDFYKF